MNPSLLKDLDPGSFLKIKKLYVTCVSSGEDLMPPALLEPGIKLPIPKYLINKAISADIRYNRKSSAVVSFMMPEGRNICVYYSITDGKGHLASVDVGTDGMYYEIKKCIVDTLTNRGFFNFTEASKPFNSCYVYTTKLIRESLIRNGTVTPWIEKVKERYSYSKEPEIHFGWKYSDGRNVGPHEQKNSYLYSNFITVYGEESIKRAVNAFKDLVPKEVYDSLYVNSII